MKATQILAVLGFSAMSMAQSLAPSPTESFGCEIHVDHWHCEGARSTTGAAVASTLSTVTTTASEDHDHDHDHDHESTGSVTLPPSPTNRGMCSPHKDHWHCDIPKSAVETASTSGSIVITSAATTGATTAATAASSASGAAATTTAAQAGAARAGFGAAAVAAAALIAL